MASRCNQNMSSSGEQLLAQKAQGGDREALGALWEALTPKLFGYLINVTRDPALAEDLLQTTWMRAIDALPRFQPRGIRIGAWLFAIARNECRQYWRKSGWEIPFDPTKHDWADNGREELEDKILTDQILFNLSENDREILRLRYIADLPLNDIARVLNLNFVTVRVRVHRALVRARAALDSQNYESYK